MRQRPDFVSSKTLPPEAAAMPYGALNGPGLAT